MNAAARDLNQCTFFTGQLANVRISRLMVTQIVLLIIVLISALSVVYVTDLYRNMLGQLETSEKQAHRLELETGQLILERATLASPARVEELASTKLKMILPVSKQTFVLRAR